MPVGVLPHQVAIACQSAWSAIPNIATLCPGGLTFGKVPPTAAVPYASLAVKQTERKLDTIGCLQKFEIAVTVYSGAGLVDSGGILEAIFAAWDEQASLFMIPDAAIIRVRLTEPAEEVEDQRRSAADVLMGRLTFSLSTDSGVNSGG